MEIALQERYQRIRQALVGKTSRDPLLLAEEVMREGFVRIHGPEHHFLDGAAFLVAYKNAGGAIDADACLDALAVRASAMPGAMCGHWGICGSVASVGAALSLIHGTGPLSRDEFYKDHMLFASEVLGAMARIGGARCCKRNAFLSLSFAARFVRERYKIPMEASEPRCRFSAQNEQCLGERCPFHVPDTAGNPSPSSQGL